MKAIVKKIILVASLFVITGLYAGDGVKIYIIHGLGTNAEGFWYPWLKSELSSEVGKEIKAENIIIPNLPSKATLQAWKDRIKALVPQVDENAYFVAHGISGIAVLKFIEESGHKVGGVVLVGGFDKAIPSDAESVGAIRDFTSATLDYKRLIQSIKHISVIAARDDKIVPYKFSENLSDKLNAKFVLEQGGRVKANQVGYTSPRLIYGEIRLMIDTDNPPPAPKVEEKKK